MKWIKCFLCRLLLVIDSTILVIVIFLLKNYCSQYTETANNCIIKNIGIVLLVFFVILLFIISLGKMSLKLTRNLSLDNLKPPYNDISDLNSSYLAAYLGYFFCWFEYK